jgi:hypothetical protein
MTVIAWDGKTLAADRRCTEGDGLIRTMTKIEKVEYHDEDGVETVLLGACGDTAVCAALVAWFKDGADPFDFPPVADSDRANLIAISAKQGVRVWAFSPHAMKFEDPTGAWGSGQDFAIAGMHLGLDAVAAVKLACIYRTDCGNGVDALSLEEEVVH